MRRVSDERAWLDDSLDRLRHGATERDLHIFLGLAPRRLGKADLGLSAADLAEAETVLPGWHPADWSVDGAARVLGLATFDAQRPFADVFKDLRRTADAAEMVALYRGLPFYPAPETLHFEVGEGLRSNLKPVFEAVAHHNPYPRDHFDEQRWNHMILKALFVGSRLTPIVGLRARANPELACILVDFAQERWAAGRPVPEDLWIPVAPFRDTPALKPVLDAAAAAGKLTEEAFA
ncbi:MAG: EboA domain-containing protein [Pseudomonadota bacterium]